MVSTSPAVLDQTGALTLKISRKDSGREVCIDLQEVGMTYCPNGMNFPDDDLDPGTFVPCLLKGFLMDFKISTIITQSNIGFGIEGICQEEAGFEYLEKYDRY